MRISRWVVQEADPKAKADLVRELGISTVLAGLLVNRGYSDPAEAKQFLHPELAQLSSPFEMLNMGAAVERILDAVDRGEKIVIYGDYDVDGICASVTLYEGLRQLNADVDYYVPNRMEEGYGVNLPALRAIFETGARLLVTVDCGISSWQEVAEAKRWGLDVVVTDHHQLPDVLPDCIIVNPVLRLSAQDRWRDLCGTGVAFKVVQGLFARRLGAPREGFDSRMQPFLDLAALATVADIVPLEGDNRILVKFGLEQIARQERPGMAALWRVSQIGELRAPNTGTLGFGLAPRLNACGRIGDVRLGLRLMLTRDAREAEEIAARLDAENRTRQEIEHAIYAAALEQVEQQGFSQREGLIVAGEGWHPGVIGIVASRLAEKFYTPTIVLTLVGGVYKGSGRSIEGFHLQRALAACADLLQNYGGHSQAAGLGLLPEALPAFRRRFAQTVAENTTAETFVPTLAIDAELSPEELDLRLFHEIEELQPTGTKNPVPLFVCRGMEVLERRVVGENHHLRLKLFHRPEHLYCIGFKKADLAPLAEEARLDIAFNLDENSYNGKVSLQLVLRDLKSCRRPDRLSLLDRLFFYSDFYLAEDPYRGAGQKEAFYTKAYGVTREDCQQALACLADGERLELRREGDPQDGESAVAVFSPAGQVGYLKREIARQLAPNLDLGIAYETIAARVTGRDTDTLGVHLFIRRAERNETSLQSSRLALRREVAAQSEGELRETIRRAVLGDAQYCSAQREALEILRAGENLLAVTGTDFEKTLLLQSYGAELALRQNRFTLIVSPLRSLAREQYQTLERRLCPLGLAAAPATGELEGEERAALFDDIENDRLDFVLATPEFLCANRERFAALGGRLGLVVVDEVSHLLCGREGYRRLPETLRKIGSPQVLALTSGADKDTARQGMDLLGIRRRILSDPVQENLQVADARETPRKLDYLLQLVNGGEKTLVYLNSRQKAVEVAKLLREKAAPAVRDTICYCHGGLSSMDRAALEEAFRSGALRVIVTTAAFAGDMDIPDIRHVVLYHLSFSCEAYRQLACRAGRDGAPARVHLLYGRRDEALNQAVLASTCPSRETLGRFYKLLLQLVQGKPAIELTNEELAARVRQARFAEPGARSVGGWLGIFEDLGFLEREREGGKRRILIVPSPSKMDLASSPRYQECLAEREEFQRYLQLAFDPCPEHLLRVLHRPADPEERQAQRGASKGAAEQDPAEKPVSERGAAHPGGTADREGSE